MTEKEKKQLVAEVNILRELNHPHIVRYIDRVLDRESCMIFLVMEFCENGDLSAVIRRCKREGFIFLIYLIMRKRIPEAKIWLILIQLLQALDECHHGRSGSHKPVLHR